MRTLLSSSPEPWRPRRRRRPISPFRLIASIARKPWLANVLHCDRARVELAHELAPHKPDLGAVFDAGEVLYNSPEFGRLR